MVSDYVKLSGESSQNLPHFSTLPPLVKPSGLSAQPRILILAPHPDDECLMAGLALRMKDEWSAQVTVVPYSYGSNVARRKARAQELQAAATVLGFDVLQRVSLEKITAPEFEDVLKTCAPEIIFSPHSRDFHPIHIAAHILVAHSGWLATQSAVKKVIWIQTEYWQENLNPNLFVPLSLLNVIKIGEALMKHKGEISRNPYHLRLPAWYIDQARRAQEILPTTNPVAGGPAPHFIFGQLLQIV